MFCFSSADLQKDVDQTTALTSFLPHFPRCKYSFERISQPTEYTVGGREQNKSVLSEMEVNSS